MALREIWIGTQGPFLVDDTDPEFSYVGQVATAEDVSGVVVSPATTVVEQRTAGMAKTVGTSAKYAREDHCHGTPDAAAVSGYAWKVKSGNFTAVLGEAYQVDTTTGSVTMLLPSTPSQGDSFPFIDAVGKFGTNKLILDGNGKTVFSAATFGVDMNYLGGTLVYNATSGDWRF